MRSDSGACEKSSGDETKGTKKKQKKLQGFSELQDEQTNNQGTASGGGLDPAVLLR